MKKETKYSISVIFCDCLECPYNDHDNDYTCTRKEIFLNQGDCTMAKQCIKIEK